jgi:hypothetical protein
LQDFRDAGNRELLFYNKFQVLSNRMPHLCTEECEYSRNLNAAAADWKEASIALADSAGLSSDAEIERNYAWFQAAKAKFMIALKASRAHLADTSLDQDIAV